MKLEISSWTIIKTLLVLAGAFVLWQIRDIIGLLFVVLIVVAALAPAVNWMVRRNVPRVVAASVVVFAIVGLFAAVLAIVIPALITQLQTFLAEQFPYILDKIVPYYSGFNNSRQLILEFLQQLQQYSGNVIAGASTLFGGIVSVLTVIVLSFYSLLDEKALRTAGLNLLPEHYRTVVNSTYERISEKLGSWLRGQFLLSFIMGMLVAVGLSLLGVPIPLALGVFAGIFEIIPYIGPWMAGALMVLMALISPEASLFWVGGVIVFFAALQFFESHVLVPNIMNKAIGLSPILVILALLVGDRLGGIVGAILAVPLAAILQVTAEDWPKLKAAKR